MVTGMPALVIDHHSAGEPFGDARMVDPPRRPRRCCVQDLFEAMGVTPTADIARLILFGLCTDTGFFRHLGGGSADTYRAVARLVELGTSTADVYMMVYGRRELASRKLLAEMLLSAESHWDDRLIVTWQMIADRERLARQPARRGRPVPPAADGQGQRRRCADQGGGAGAFSVGLRSTSARRRRRHCRTSAAEAIARPRASTSPAPWIR